MTKCWVVVYSEWQGFGYATRRIEKIAHLSMRDAARQLADLVWEDLDACGYTTEEEDAPDHFLIEEWELK